MRRRLLVEAVTGLNALASASPCCCAQPKPPSGHGTPLQKGVLRDLSAGIASFGFEGSTQVPQEALAELLHSGDVYDIDVQPTVDFDRTALRLLKGEGRPVDLRRCLPEEARRFLDEPRLVERTAADMDRCAEAGELPDVTPYWDPVLRRDAAERNAFLEELLRLGLGTLRRGIRAEIGMFCVAKKLGAAAVGY